MRPSLGADGPGVPAAIGEIDDPGYREVALAALGRPISFEALLEMERGSREPDPKDNHAFSRNIDAYTNLAGRAPAAFVPHLLTALKDLHSESRQAELMLALAPKIPFDLLPDALQILEKLDLEEAAQVLAALIARFRDLPVQDLKPLWWAARSVLTGGRRLHALETLAKIAELISLIGGRSGVDEAAWWVIIVGEWFQ